MPVKQRKFIKRTREEIAVRKEESRRRHLEQAKKEFECLPASLDYDRLKERGRLAFVLRKIQRLRKLNGVDRGTLPGFVWYMKQRPAYFEQFCGRPFSVRAATQEFRAIYA